MTKKIHLPLPMQKGLRILGKNISDARRRRRIPMELLSERCGISRLTLSKIEKGNPSVSMGAYASALFVLGLSEDLTRVADPSHDIVGRELEEEHLPKRIRSPRSNKGEANE
ncbi:helix-turn-helix domain-containing protein [Legionella quinlivanii]|uniref:helix-turn-helix domain-containing protein n=1 Tax=Legionella quinlivanii TaxID=45073 RepID=UPI002243DEAA|nr:helix-turn-helix transcriptional regulator [Legionella quinlivanii]MCW8452616.1 helix-turn-helix domain-containing protein [Legionella quinlivanii]